MNINFNVDSNGYYGKFGGVFVPKELEANIKELRDNYRRILDSDEFQNEYINLLKTYVGRPSSLYFSEKLSQQYAAKIYLKREDLNHTGAHKINNTIGQIILAKHMNKKHIIAETGAGQHGVATATVCALFDMECTIYMGAEDIKRQSPNVSKMKMLGANVVAATTGTQTLSDAVNEALNAWVCNPSAYYLLGSAVGPHPYPDLVSRLQSVISKEIKAQLTEYESVEYPDYVIACVGGGSNAAGAFYEFLDHLPTKLVGVEAAGLGLDTTKHAASLTKGKEAILHGSKTLVIQDENDAVMEAYSISPGLDYPGIGPQHAYLHDTKRVKYIAVTDDEAMNAAINLTKKEGIIPAIESSHALAGLAKIDFKENDIVVLNLSGRGDKDIEAYIEYLKLN
ncbi:MAG: tryptophan synthase subunit beta [Marinifilaceae bacterium]|jgi:tryptophan synthase beta chain|nr:tryptophan synthase subunit beta [Marinifilaceae bacterium]